MPKTPSAGADKRRRENSHQPDELAQQLEHRNHRRALRETRREQLKNGTNNPNHQSETD